MPLLFQNSAVGLDQAANSGAADVGYASQVEQKTYFFLLYKTLHHIEEMIRAVTRVKTPGYLYYANRVDLSAYYFCGTSHHSNKLVSETRAREDQWALLDSNQ